MRDRNPLNDENRIGLHSSNSRPDEFDDILTKYQAPLKRAGEADRSSLPDRFDVDRLFATAARIAPLDAKAEPPAETKEKQDAKEKERKDLQAQLEKTFSISFGKEGEKVKYYGTESTCRNPTLDELKALEGALYRSQPSHVNPDGKPLKFEFLNEAIRGGATAFHTNGHIVVQDGIKRLKPMHDDTDAYNGPGGKEDSMMATFIHELSHNTQLRLDDRFAALSTNSPEQAKRGEALGFRKIVDEKGRETIWVLEGSRKSDGKNQDLFRQVPGDVCNWYRCDEKGKVLEEVKEGKRSLVEHLNNCDMPGRTKVNLPTTYHSNPTEAEAEALTCLRLGGASLEMLVRKCPEAYNAVRDLDRRDTIKTYGTLPDNKNEPKYIRNKKGNLVPNTEEARKAMKEFEESCRAKKDK
jgi:hypothetical protein